ncbi:MAG: valine--pyruvate transaminase [Ectothiorhodospiraceae bacterium]|nr:valine--pyruvate transaminase [Chromatiales bacterium]MCP5156986.1 valine--pyruvate transaminase [Ectothiorhodospiraceae bacterium]
MQLSKLGLKLTAGAGIVRLMDDLGEAAAGRPDMAMLGGGNPGRIPEVESRLRARMQRILADGDTFERLIGAYDSPQGPADFVRAVASLLRRELGWPVHPENIAVTNGSQSASFMLFNLLGGEALDGTHRRIFLPLTPEYVGYADQGVTDGLFVSRRPEIELLDDRLFKYRVDLRGLEMPEDVAAVCVSRPTNPTGNVLTDDEVAALAELAASRDVPLIIDSAYGLPFPGIVFRDATPHWNERTVVCMSLSKIGLPGVRTGIVVAAPEMVRALVGMNAIVNLTTGGFGPALALDMIRDGEILRLARDVVRPFYQGRAEMAVDLLRHELDGLDFWIHRPEGAIFLWAWFRDLPITSDTLYRRLKDRGVLVLSGHHFFPGLEGAWRHRDECVRINCSQSTEMVQRGLRVLCEEVRRAYGEG